MGWAEAEECVRMTRKDIIPYGSYGKRVLYCMEDQFYLENQRGNNSEYIY